VTEAILTLNGRSYGGWKSIEINLGIEQISGGFKLHISDRWHGQDAAWPILPGDACTVAIGKTVVITGYVDEANPQYDHQSHGIEITGRDKTGDLVDCSAIYKTGQWHGAGLLKIAQDICSPFGITVRADADTGKKFQKFSLQEGESAFEAISRAARMRGILPVSDGTGALVLTRAATTRIDVPLIKGKNIESASGCFSHKDRFSKYIVKGQAPGSDIFAQPEHHAQLKATATDDAIGRYRPLIVYTDPADGSTYRDRAIWERNVRAGRAARVQYTVAGWEYKPGSIWVPNRMVHVQDSYIGVDAELLITSCCYSLDESGSKTRLELSRREAFDLINLPNMKRLSALGKTVITGTKDSTIKDKEPLKW
jgi:prophage tail gpP-like protein